MGIVDAALLSALMSYTSDVICVLDGDGRIRWANPAMTELTGYVPDDVAGLSAFELVHPDEREAVATSFFEGITRPGRTDEVGLRLRYADGGWRPVTVRANNRLDDPIVSGVVVTVTDRSALHRTVSSLERSERRYRAVVNALEEGVVVCGTDGRVESCNPAAARILNTPEEALVGRPFARVPLMREDGSPMPPDEFPTRDSLRTGWARRRVVVGLQLADGLRWLSITTRPVFGGGRMGPTSVVTSFVDITEVRQAEADLRLSEQRFRSLVHNASDAVLVCDAGGWIRWASPPATRLLGRDADDLIGIGLADLVGVDDLAAVDGLFRSVADGAVEVPPLEFQRAGAPDEYLEAVMTNLLDDPAVAGIVVRVRDVTERRRVTDELTHQALHDPLTGLPNRALFMDRAAHSLSRIRRQPGRLALLFADVDRFKQVNDNLGHDAGDRVLAAIARRVRQALRPGDTVARFAGDEFVVLCEAVTEAEATQIAERLSGVAAAPIEVGGGQELYVTMSVGLALTDDPAMTAEALLTSADAAMYRAKQEGRARSRLYDASMSAPSDGRADTERGLRRALEQDELSLVFQPVVRLTDGRVRAAEALVRWSHPDRGLLLPADFLPVAEDSGLVVPLGEWVLREACRQAASWPGGDGGAPLVSVNVSPRQLGDVGLPDAVATALGLAGLPAGRLCLEVSESALLRDPAGAARSLGALKDAGVLLCVDDFGTACSSLAHLQRFPLDIVKVDRSFVRHLETPDEDAAVVSTALGLARGLGLSAVAEGVESAVQAERLVAMGYHYGQGFHFAAPVAPARMAALLAGRRRLP